MNVESLNAITQTILEIPIVGEYVPIIFGVVTICSGIAMLFPTPDRDSWYRPLWTFLIDLPALNIFRAKQD